MLGIFLYARRFGPTYDPMPYDYGPYPGAVNPHYGPGPYRYAPYRHWYAPRRKSKVAAGLLGIFLGVFGIHNFYLGYTGKAVVQLLITLLSAFLLSWVSALWGFIEGIVILCARPGRYPWGVDARGVPLTP